MCDVVPKTLALNLRLYRLYFHVQILSTMDKDQITQIVNGFIANNELKEALQALSDYVKGRNSYLENDLLLQTSSFNGNEKDREKGVITGEDYKMGKARTRNNLTQIMGRLPEEGNEVVIQTSELNITTSSHPKSENGIRKILFLAATPEDQVQLNLGKEFRKIKTQLSAAKHRNKFKVENEMAVRISDITQAMQDHKPQIVHFSGHGSGKQGLVVEDDAGNTVFFPTKGINRLFRLFKKDVKCVVLNACFASEQAEVISQHGIYVVGMNDAIGDKAATDFATGFYQSLGAGNDYEFAFDIALVTISSHIDDADTPELWYDGKKVDI